MDKIRRFALFYFAFQGVAVLAWWLVLFFVPPTRKFFQMGESETVLMAFWLPDMFLLSVGSLITAFLCRNDSRFLQISLWFTTGTIVYATFYCLAFAILTDSGWLGVTLMFPAMIWSGNFAVGLSSPFTSVMFRRSNESRPSWIMMKTFWQIVVVWTIILFIFPALIVSVENKLGIGQFIFPMQKTMAAIFFVLVSLAGIAGAFEMVRKGRGTPLPMDTASRLVISGIYGFVRNPMAVSGIGQGVAVALFYGSPLVFLYALMGGLIWQIIFRPLEEADLLKTFGADYENYRLNVRCWIPRTTKFNPE